MPETITSPTPQQIHLLRDIRMNGAVHGLLFSDHRFAGPSLREAGLITGVGDSTNISERGYEILRLADQAFYASKSEPSNV